MQILKKLSLGRATMALAASLIAVAYSATLSAPVAAGSSSQLFGIGGGGGGTSLPASCDISKLLAQNKDLLNSIAQINNQEQAQLKQINIQQTNLKPGDEAGNAALQAQQQQILDSAKAQLANVKAQQEIIKQQTQGPSEQCKRDTVANSIAEMQNVQSVLKGSVITGSFNKIDTEVAKIEALEPSLQKNGVNDKDMQTIKTSVTAVKADTATLRGFISAMSSKSAAFVGQASADPIGTYNAMQSGGGPLDGISGNTQGAMSNLVTSFTNLVNLFDKLSSNTGGQ